eukprot:1105444-Amorphochlora_amoeboformis.AAC.1
MCFVTCWVSAFSVRSWCPLPESASSVQSRCPLPVSASGVRFRGPLPVSAMAVPTSMSLGPSKGRYRCE